MSVSEDSAVIERVDPAYRQIAAYFERQICSGKLRPGERMPTTSDIAKHFNVNPNTVQQGFELLLKRGIVERKRKRGSFVSPGVNSRSVGVVFGKEIFTDINRRFYSVVLAELQREFSEAMWDTKLYYTAEFEHGGKVIAEMDEDLRRGKIRAVIEFCSNEMVRGWLSSEAAAAKMPLPEIDECGIIIKGLEYLVQAGYRRPAIIFNLEKLKMADDMVTAAKTGLKRLGLRIDECGLEYCATSDQGGYEAARKLLGRPSRQRPDSLLVANDNACRGVIYAALEGGVAIPAKLGLITHRNKGIDIFSPVPLTCLEVDPAAYAKALVEHGLRKLAGGRDGVQGCGKVGASLVIGESCGEKL